MTLKRTMREGISLEAGTYEVQLIDLKEDILENPQFGDGAVIRFELETTDVLDEEGNPVRLDGIASDKLTPLSKLTRWLKAFGVTAEPGEEIDMARAIGQRAQAVIVLRPGKDGTGSFPRIEDLVALPRSRAVRPAPVNDISDWWKATRERGLNRKEVLDRSQELFGCEPAELAPEDRAELMESFAEEGR